MSVKAITMYRSEDGRTHETRAEALKYDALQKNLANVKTLLAPYATNCTNTLFLDLTNNVKLITAMRDQLNKALEYHRYYGKNKKA